MGVNYIAICGPTAGAKFVSADLAPIVAAIRASGITSARGIANALTDRGIGTARGSET